MIHNDMSSWIVARRKQAEKNSQKQHYYMTNLNNPIIRSLYFEWKRKNGYGGSVAPGDEERTAFELSLFAPEIRERLQEMRTGSNEIKEVISNAMQGVPTADRK